MRSALNFLLQCYCSWKDSLMQWTVQKGDPSPGAWNPNASFSVKLLWDHPEEVSFPCALLLTTHNRQNSFYTSLPCGFQNVSRKRIMES